MSGLKSVLVIGTGTIGEPLIGLLASLKDRIGIDEVIFHKQTLLLADRSKVLSLMRRGAKLAVNEGAAAEFEKLGMCPSYEKTEAINRSPTVGAHEDERFGTHHARDAHELFKTIGLDLKLFSSALKINTQYMHTIWFDLKLTRPTTLEEVEARLMGNSQVAVTHKTSANLVLSFGRDHGHYGRILNNAVGEGGHRVTGFCFTPQDGNSLLSSLAAALWFLDPQDYRTRLEVVRPYMFDEV